MLGKYVTVTDVIDIHTDALSEPEPKPLPRENGKDLAYNEFVDRYMAPNKPVLIGNNTTTLRQYCFYIELARRKSELHIFACYLLLEYFLQTTPMVII